MAGLDRLKASDFIAMLQTPGDSADPAQLCTDLVQAMQMASDSLLLRERDMPLSVQTFSGCCDTVTAKRKEFAIHIKMLTTDMDQKDYSKLHTCLAAINEHLLIVTETAAQGAYLLAHKSSTKPVVPSVVDMYKLKRAKLAIEVAVHNFERTNLKDKQVMAVAAVVSTHLDVLRDECAKASETLKTEKPLQAAIFENSSRGLSGSTAMLVAAIKALVKDISKDNLVAAQILAKPVLSCVEALIAFVENDPSFKGTPPTVTREIALFVKPLQAAAVAVSSACTLMIGGVRTILTNPSDQTAPATVHKYANLVNESLTDLVSAVKRARDAKIVS
eukprot:m.88106 g.88106  ORF g.88106 m.88106 type:complete len:332 (+) comp13143_c0_seq1:223-1218(+)